LAWIDNIYAHKLAFVGIVLIEKVAGGAIQMNSYAVSTQIIFPGCVCIAVVGHHQSSIVDFGQVWFYGIAPGSFKHYAIGIVDGFIGLEDIAFRAIQEQGIFCALDIISLDQISGRALQEDAVPAVSYAVAAYIGSGGVLEIYRSTAIGKWKAPDGYIAAVYAINRTSLWAAVQGDLRLAHQIIDPFAICGIAAVHWVGLFKSNISKIINIFREGTLGYIIAFRWRKIEAIVVFPGNVVDQNIMAGLGQENAPSVFLHAVFRQGIAAGVIKK